MKIFISHAPIGNFEEELYIPLQNSELFTQHEFVLPHEGGETINIKDTIRECDLVVAECSQMSFEQGLELGWANGAYVTTVCFYKTGSTISPLLHQVSDIVSEYGTTDDLLAKIKESAEAI